LSADELYTLAKVMPGFTQEYRWQIYRNVVREALEQKSSTPSSSLKAFESLRQKLGIADEAHGMILDQLQLDFPQIFPLPQRQIRDHDSTIVRRDPPAPGVANHDATVVRFNPPDSPPSDPDRTVWRNPADHQEPPPETAQSEDDPDRTLWRQPADQ
jgi:hypothetical protein